MSDVKAKIDEVFSRPQLCGLATVTEDGKPWVRYVIAFHAPDNTIRFATHLATRKVRQMQANPEVHLTCGITDPEHMTPFLQIQGRARISTDAADKKALWYGHLERIFKGPDDPDYGVVIVDPYRIEYCVPGTMQPEVWEA